MEQPEPESPISPYENDIKAIKYISKSRHAIYLATDSKSQRKFALKTYFYENDEICGSYNQELRIKSLMHENILSIIDSKSRKRDQHNKLFSYNLMEYCPHGTLGEFFSETDPYKDPKLVRTIFRQIVSGIEYLHKNGISHMDLKPSNIMVGEDFVIKIIDFEFAFFERDSGILGRGTSGFRAPEVRVGNCKDPKAGDIFALGIVLFALFTGNHPYKENFIIEGRDLEEMVLSQNKEFWSVQSKISKTKKVEDKEFKDLFWSMVKKDPSNRIKIEDVKKSKWFNREVYSKEEYKKVMASYYC